MFFLHTKSHPPDIKTHPHRIPSSQLTMWSFIPYIHHGVHNVHSQRWITTVCIWRGWQKRIRRSWVHWWVTYPIHVIISHSPLLKLVKKQPCLTWIPERWSDVARENYLEMLLVESSWNWMMDTRGYPIATSDCQIPIILTCKYIRWICRFLHLNTCISLLFISTTKSPSVSFNICG